MSNDPVSNNKASDSTKNDSPDRTSLPKPRLCERRNYNRKNSTWGERSVAAFEFIEQVGAGTYGHVYKARMKDTGRF